LVYHSKIDSFPLFLDPMRIRLNGKPHDVTAPLSVAELLQELDLAETAMAVAVNRTVVRKADRQMTRLQEGDEVEVIRAVAGG